LNTQNELLDLIDNYLNDGMSEKERSAFEEKMASDETLSAKVTEVRNTNEAIYYASLAEMKKQIGQDIKNIQYKPAFNWTKATYISIASLAVLSGITAYLISDNSKSETNKTESIKALKETEEKSLQKNTISSPQDKDPDRQKLPSIPFPTNKEMKDTLSLRDKVIDESFLPDNNIRKIQEESSNIVSENKTLPNNTDSDNKKPIISSSNNNANIVCDKSFKINTEASCKQKETGSIVILSDSEYDYTFQVDNYISSGSRCVLQDISAGDYEIRVTYGKECLYTKKITVPEKWCGMNSSYSFNPDYNEKWTMKYEPGASGTLSIFDRFGKEIYTNTFGSGNEEWKGTDKDGLTLAVGVYIALINYSDGRKEKVELTIIR